MILNTTKRNEICSKSIKKTSERRHFKQAQNQPSRGVLRKSCSENMQEIYRRTPMPSKATLLKSHFGMVVLL